MNVPTLQRRPAPLARRQFQLLGLASLLAFLIASGWLLRDLGEVSLGVDGLLFAFCAGLVLLIVLVTPRLAHGEWFHPLAFPSIYVGVALLVPTVYVLWGGETLLGITPDRISDTLVLALGLCFVGLAAGCALGLGLTRPGSAEPRASISYDGVLQAGRLILVLTIILHMPAALSSIGQAYGTAPGSGHSAADAAAAALLFVGIIMTTLGCLHRYGRVATRVEVLLFGFYVLVTLTQGRRGEMIAPVIFMMWAHHVYVSRLGLARTLLGIVVVATLFQGVVGTRGNDPFYAGSSSYLERTIGSIGTPMQVTELVERQVPDHNPYKGGDTYLAALERQLPGPVTRFLLGAPTETGTFVLRDMYGQTDPNSGFSFSLPAEGYLNFGLLGAVLAGFLVGGLLGVAYRKQAHRELPVRATQVLYPIVIATIPLSLRSDALTQIKSVLYPMLILAVVLAVNRTGRGRIESLPAERPATDRVPA